MNTWFQKPNHELITYRTASRAFFEPPFDFEHFGQYDYVLVKRPWRNTITDINALTRSPFESDHKPLVMSCRTKLAKKEKPTMEKTKRYRKPNEEDCESYNSRLRELYKEHNWENQDTPIELFSNLIKQAAEDRLTEIPPNQKQPYISEKAWGLMEKRQKQLEENNWTEARETNNEIKKQVKQDKIDYKLEQLEEIDKDGYKWDGLKQLKQKFTPKFTKFIDKDGKRIPPEQYAHKAAEYLENVQWKKIETTPPTKSFKQDKSNFYVDESVDIKDEKFHIKELDIVLSKMKRNKTPGPDNVTAEIVMWLDQDNREKLLEEINKIAEKEKLKNALT